MKILILGSSGIHITRWAEFFLKKGYEVVLVIGFDYQNEKMKIYRIDMKYGVLSFVKNVMKLKDVIKAEKPDILYTQYLTTYGIMAAMTGFKNLALSIIGSDIYVHIKKFPFNILAKRYINRFKMINVECKGVKDDVLQFYNYPNNVIVRNWGIDFTIFNPQIDRMEVRNKYKIIGNDKLIVSARALIPRCNIETIIRAFDTIRKSRNDVKLLVVGDGKSAKKLKKIADDFNLTEHVVFTGAVPHEELGKYIRCGDVYVQTSLGDTVSITLMDAMACKVPCISSDVGCTKEFLKHEENGILLADPMDYSQLAKYTNELLNDDNRCEKFAEKGYEIVLKSWDEKTNMEYIENEMKKLVS